MNIEIDSCEKSIVPAMALIFFVEKQVEQCARVRQVPRRRAPVRKAEAPPVALGNGFIGGNAVQTALADQ